MGKWTGTSDQWTIATCKVANVFLINHLSLWEMTRKIDSMHILRRRFFFSKSRVLLLLGSSTYHIGSVTWGPHPLICEEGSYHYDLEEVHAKSLLNIVSVGGAWNMLHVCTRVSSWTILHRKLDKKMWLSQRPASPVDGPLQSMTWIPICAREGGHFRFVPYRGIAIRRIVHAN